MQIDEINIAKHWDKIYANVSEHQLGWYEDDPAPTLRLLDQFSPSKNDRILVVGAGNTTLVDHLIAEDYTNLIATDISKIALEQLNERLCASTLESIVDDLTHSTKLTEIAQVDCWIDRAVLHFFTTEEERSAYFDLLKKLLASGGYVILAEFSLKGAKNCSGLPVYRYSVEMLQDNLGPEFILKEAFEYNYVMPAGDERPYIYALFRRN